MTTIRHPARKRQPASILRRYEAGYKIATIAHELRIPRHEVVNVLFEQGVKWASIAVRMR